jgi:hypothetical protein
LPPSYCKSPLGTEGRCVTLIRGEPCPRETGRRLLMRAAEEQTGAVAQPSYVQALSAADGDSGRDCADGAGSPWLARRMQRLRRVTLSCASQAERRARLGASSGRRCNRLRTGANGGAERQAAVDVAPTEPLPRPTRAEWTVLRCVGLGKLKIGLQPPRYRSKSSVLLQGQRCAVTPTPIHRLDRSPP